MKSKKIKILLLTLCVLIIGCSFYLTSSYKATQDAHTFLQSTNEVRIETPNTSLTVFKPAHPKAGIIFYPGGKVEPIAYAPLLYQLAQNDILCILVSMPFDLAVLNANAADDLQDNFPEIKHWYMAGHSLGGAMAATYISKHIPNFDGLILLAAYSTVDLSQTPLKVISIYGSNDQILNREKYQTNLVHLPSDYLEYIIEGGNHAYFGMYGPQKGDGIAALTNEAQIKVTSDFLSSLI